MGILMATLFNRVAEQKWALEWGWTFNGKRTTKTKSSKWKTPQDKKRAPAQLQQQLREVETVEDHVRTGVAPNGGPAEIDRWITSKYITEKMACAVWLGYQASVAIKTDAIDWAKIKEGFEQHYLNPLKPGAKSRNPNRKSFKNHMIQYAYIEKWLKASHPTLTPSDADLLKWQESLLNKGESSSTVNTRRCALNVVLEVARKLEMINRNPLKDKATAPIKTLPQIQKKPRRPMSATESSNTIARITEKLDIYSSPYGSERRKYPMSGCLPIAFFMGWYMGLRNEEVRWATWDSIDYEQGIYYVQETTCTLTGEVWDPKDKELRTLKIINRMMEWFKWEHKRQKNLVERYTQKDRDFGNLPPGKKVGDIKNPSPLGQFIIPSGQYQKHYLRGRAIGETALRRSFKDFIDNESDLYRTPLPTFYSGRHTFATENARAGMKTADLQARMGHSDFRTTMKYIEAVRAEDSTIEEDLPY